jgi:hypothetical protein
MNPWIIFLATLAFVLCLRSVRARERAERERAERIRILRRLVFIAAVLQARREPDHVPE